VDGGASARRMSKAGDGCVSGQAKAGRQAQAASIEKSDKKKECGTTCRCKTGALGGSSPALHFCVPAGWTSRHSI